MASLELKRLTDLDVENPSELVDVIAVGGVNDIGDNTWLGYSTEGLPEWLRPSPNVRLSTFSYGLEDIFVRLGIESVATRLLNAASDLRAGDNPNRDLIFICHDVGGIVVKQALIMSGSGDPMFRSIAASTRCIVFMGCPHQCRSIESLRQSFHALFKQRTSPDGHLSPILAESLARSALSIGYGFLEAKLLMKIASINISSAHEDMEERIFDPYETTLSLRSGMNDERLLQVESELPHRCLGDSEDNNVAVFLSSVLEPHGQIRRHSDTLELLIPQAFPQRLSPAWDAEPAPIPTTLQDILNQKSNQDANYIAVHDPDDATGTALSIRQYLMQKVPGPYVHQFFQFREWDTRCNSVDSLLCTFLVDLSSYSTSKEDHSTSEEDSNSEKDYRTLEEDQLEIFREGVVKFHAWSRHHLLSTFYDYLSHSQGLTWILVDFDERIASYHWLLSSLCDFVRCSGFKFNLVIVNSRQLDLGVNADCFDIISPPQAKANDTRGGEALIGMVGDNLNNDNQIDHSDTAKKDDDEDLAQVYAVDQDYPAFRADQEILELTVENPDLYPIQGRLFQLARECQGDLKLQKLLFEWLKLKTAGISHLDLEGQLLSSVTRPHLFQRLWLPSSATTASKEQTCVATSLLFYSFRPFTVQELDDLEQNTSYGNQIGRGKNTYFSGQSPRTLELLSGVTDVYQNEVRFCHAQFRDFLASHPLMGSTGRDGAEGVSRGAHARITRWCLERLRKANPQEWMHSQTDDEHTAVPELRGLCLSYAVKHWLRHAKMASQEAGSLLEGFLDDTALVQNWTKAYWSLSNPAWRPNLSSATTLAIFAECGQESLLKDAIASSEDTSSFQRQAFHALEAAARSGSAQMVKCLLTSPLPEGQHLDGILLRSFASGSVDVVREIIQLTKRQPNGIQDHLAMLGWAAYHGFADAVSSLIPLVSAKDVEEAGCIPLHLALRGARTQPDSGLRVITLLVDAHYPLEGNLNDGKPFSALNTACILGISRGVLCLAKAMFTGSSNSDEKQAWPEEFLSATKAALEGAHHQVLQVLLEFALARGWVDIGSAGDLFKTLQDAGKPQCSKTLSSHVVKVVEASDELKEDACSILLEAFTEGEVSIVTDLLFLQGGLQASNFSSLLHAAVKVGIRALDTVRLLVEEGLRVCDKETWHGALCTALKYVMSSNDPELASFLLDKAPSAQLQTVNGLHAIYFSAYFGREKMVNLLIQAKADVDVIGNSDDWRPIHAAYDYPKILDALLAAGADPNAKTGSGNTALFFACRWGYLESVKVLLKHGARACCYVDQETELSTAAEGGYEEIACMLLDSGVDPLEHPASKLDTPLLHSCVVNNLSKLLKELLLYNFSIDDTDSLGDSALNSITANTKIPVLELLLKRGASLSTTNKKGDTPLSKAIKCSNEEVFRWLLEMGADVNAPVGRRGSILHVACFQGSFNMTKLLCENKHTVFRNDPGSYGTPLHAVLRRPDEGEDKAAIINYLLEIKDFDLNQNSLWWGSHLSVACLCANLDVVEKLLEKGITVDTKDRIGRQPIHFALYRTLDHVKMLVGRGASLGATDLMCRNALHFAVVSGRLDVVTFVLDSDPAIVGKTDIDGWTPLMWAVRACNRWNIESNERQSIIEKLKERGVDQRVQGEGIDRKWTAYKLALYHDLDDDIVDCLKPDDHELEELNPPDKAWWTKSLGTPQKKGREFPRAYCDACLINCIGITYRCEECKGFCLCFKCYQSRNLIHPRHSFTNSGEAYEYENSSSTETSSQAYLSEDEESEDDLGPDDEASSPSEAGDGSEI